MYSLTKERYDPAVADDGVNVRDMLDPELRAVFSQWVLPPPEQLVALARQPSAAAGPDPSAPDRPGAVIRTDHVVPGNPPVKVRVHRPPGATGPLPAIVSLHGGGYMIGSYDSDDELFAAWCPRLGVAGVSVEYRLAPEVPYPGPLEDCYAALMWAVKNATELGIDPARVGVHGISAGGGLAAGLALLARDRGEVTLAFQALDCPMLDDRQRTPSINAAGLYLWTRDHNDLGWRSYLGDLHGARSIPDYAVPARAADLAGLPSACIVVGAIDGFRDECIDYAQRLSQAGVACDLHVIAGLPHGYQQVPAAAAVRQARRDLEDWLARQLTPAGHSGGDEGTR